MSYGLTDFTESLERVELQAADVARVLAAWGEAGDINQWSGGFVLLLHDGRIAVLTGWCDTTGWGCQDGADLRFVDAPRPELFAAHGGAEAYRNWLRVGARLAVTELLQGLQVEPGGGWDDYPADLNEWLARDGAGR